MSLKVIGAGVGRTGTFSLKLAIERLGFGPCHHMVEVLKNQPVQVPLWAAAAAGKPDWPAIYAGFHSAVDWPTGRFFRELHAAYPEAKFVLSHRDPDNWVESFSETIYKLMASKDPFPPEMHAWHDMCDPVIAQTGFPQGLDKAELRARFVAHNDAVKATIPADQLLVYQVKEGWGPLCDFLGVAAPDEPFPRTNDRIEFWDHVKAGA